MYFLSMVRLLSIYHAYNFSLHDIHTCKCLTKCQHSMKKLKCFSIKDSGHDSLLSSGISVADLHFDFPFASLGKYFTKLKGILCDFVIFTLDQIIKYCTYNKHIPTILHVKTLQNLCKIRYQKTIRM